jgi:hypothetical protein
MSSLNMGNDLSSLESPERIPMAAFAWNSAISTAIRRRQQLCLDTTHLLHHVGQLSGIKLAQLVTESPQGIFAVLVRIPPRDDRDDDALDGIAAERDLRCIASAESLASRKGEAGQVLEEGALAGRLAAGDDDLVRSDARQFQA